jgi:hypothetical protein
MAMRRERKKADRGPNPTRKGSSDNQEQGAHGFTMLKKHGQHLLKNPMIIQKIVDKVTAQVFHLPSRLKLNLQIPFLKLAQEQVI